MQHLLVSYICEKIFISRHTESLFVRDRKIEDVEFVEEFTFRTCIPYYHCYR